MVELRIATCGLIGGKESEMSSNDSLIAICLTDRICSSCVRTVRKAVRGVLYVALSVLVLIVAFIVGAIISGVFLKAVELRGTGSFTRT